MKKGLEENIKGLEEVILDHKKHIDSLKECCKTLDELKDAAINDMNKFKALMLAAVEELRKEKEEYRKIHEIPKETPKETPKEIPKETPKETPKEIPKETPKEIPKPELPKTEYEYIMDLVKDVSNVVYNEFKVMTWSASVDISCTFHKPLQYVAHKRYVIKYNVYERSMALMDNYWDIDPLSTKAFEEFFLYDLIKTLIEKLKDAGFTVHHHVDEHPGLTCGDTHIIELWR